jgi:hypothetical protein
VCIYKELAQKPGTYNYLEPPKTPQQPNADDHHTCHTHHVIITHHHDHHPAKPTLTPTGFQTLILLSHIHRSTVSSPPIPWSVVRIDVESERVVG